MNRSMAAKFAKAKKCAVQEMTEQANNRACATRVIPSSSSVNWNRNYIPYSSAKRHISSRSIYS